MRQLHLHRAVTPLALAGFGFRPLALGQIEHERDAFGRTFFERDRTDQHGHTAAVFAEVLLLEGLDGPDHLQLGHGPGVAVAPFRRRQIRPAQATGDEIRPVVADYPQKRLVRLDDPAVESPDDDADDIGIDQAPDLGFTFREIAVQTGILQRDRRLRGEQLQHRELGRREDAGGQIVLEVERADRAWPG